MGIGRDPPSPMRASGLRASSPRSNSWEPGGALTCTSSHPQVAQLPLFVSDGKWHHICVTWTTRGRHVGGLPGRGEAGHRGEPGPLAPHQAGRCALILGQEQVSVAGHAAHGCLPCLGPCLAFCLLDLALVTAARQPGWTPGVPAAWLGLSHGLRG